MPREARQSQMMTSYHIMVQGINKEYIFDDDKLKKKYLFILREKLSEYNAFLIAYCMMDNHAHFLVYNGEEGAISALFHKVNLMFSNSYNKRNSRVGYVFRDRFKSQEIYNHWQFINCIRYIHNNPVVAKMVASPQDYVYSSFREYQYESSVFIDFKMINGLFNKYDGLDYLDEECENYGLEFIDDEKTKNQQIAFFLNKFNTPEIKNDKEKLKQAVIECRNVTGASAMKIAEFFGISCSKVHRWIRGV